MRFANRFLRQPELPCYNQATVCRRFAACGIKFRVSKRLCSNGFIAGGCFNAASFSTPRSSAHNVSLAVPRMWPARYHRDRNAGMYGIRTEGSSVVRTRTADRGSATFLFGSALPAHSGSGGDRASF